MESDHHIRIRGLLGGYIGRLPERMQKGRSARWEPQKI